MTTFYIRALEDEELGPFFMDELGSDIESEEWVDHVELLADFWLAKLSGEKTYVGNYIGAHVKLPHIKREMFARWIKLFSITADEIYTPDLSERFKKKGIELSKQFMRSKMRV